MRSIVVVDQARDDLLALADVVYVLSRGQMRWAGEPGELSDATLHSVLS
jgi:ABC-type branched-subunit amino acid transport system ATPase component